MARRTYISIAISLTLHVIALLIFAGVKLYRDVKIEDRMAVVFVPEQKVNPLRRSLLVRPMTSVDKSPQHRPAEQNSVRVEYNMSTDVYFSAPEREFSEVKDLAQGAFPDADIQRPAIEYKNRLSKPMTTDLLKEPYLRGIQVQPRIYRGSDLLSDMAPAQAKPGMVSTENVLQKFAAAVRKKIESRKKYPLSARTYRIEGRAGIKFTISKDGNLQNVEIIESSGHDVLDRAALQSVQNAAPFPPIPEAAKLDKIQMSIRLTFKLSA